MATYALTICLYLIFAMSSIAPSCHADNIKTNLSSLRGSSAVASSNKSKQEDDYQQQQRHRNLQRPDHPCLLVRVETEYAQIKVNGVLIEETFIEDTMYFDGPSQTELRCELLGEDVDKAGQYFVPILGIDEAEIVGDDYFVSGETTMIAEGAAFLDGALRIPADAAIEFGIVDENDERKLRRTQRQQQQQQQLNLNNRRQLATVGTKKVLAIRVRGSDVSTTSSSAVISNNLFGTSGDSITMASQYRRCSHGKLIMEPYIGRTYNNDVYISNGVLEVDIPDRVDGSNRRDIENAAQLAARDKVGDLRQFDHVMLCLPPGSSGNKWIAYAYVNSWLSVYNDEWCRMLSVQVHEMGHNLGLAHSGANGVSYGDKSGMMGFSYYELDKPIQCFNPAKSFELGWYEDKTVTWDPFRQGTWFGTLVGVADYQRYSTTTIVKIDRGGTDDLYIGYNRKKDMNSGVASNGDEVTIVQESSGYSESTLLAGLDVNDVHRFGNFENSGKTLVVKYIESRSNWNEAFVAIYFEDCVYPSCCTGDLCNPKPPQITPPPPIVIQPPPEEENQEIKQVDIPHPILMEVYPNPMKQKAEYIEIYNPTNERIFLLRYEVCVTNGNLESMCVPITGLDWLGPGEFFMICRDKEFVVNNGLLVPGRVCHEDAKSAFIIRNRKVSISLKLKDELVDKIYIGNSRKNVNEAYVRQNGCKDARSRDCWGWSQPAMTAITLTENNDGYSNDSFDNNFGGIVFASQEAAFAATTTTTSRSGTRSGGSSSSSSSSSSWNTTNNYHDDDDDGILSEEAGVEIAIQSLPPIDEANDENSSNGTTTTYTIGDSLGDFLGDDDDDNDALP